jgi:hypothetical protein
MAMEFKYNISNFIKALQIIEKYSVPNYYPYSIVDDYRITFNVDYEKARNMPDEDRIALEDLGISVENGYVYTEEYNI